MNPDVQFTAQGLTSGSMAIQYVALFRSGNGEKTANTFKEVLKCSQKIDLSNKKPGLSRVLELSK